MRLMLSFLTSIGTSPSAATASVKNAISFAAANFPISLIGWIVPISLLAKPIEMSIMSGYVTFQDKMTGMAG